MSYKNSDFAGAEIDFSPLAQIGTIPQRLRDRKLRQAFESGAFTNPEDGSTNWGAMTQALGVAGHAPQALTAGEIGERSKRTVVKDNRTTAEKNYDRAKGDPAFAKELHRKEDATAAYRKAQREDKLGKINYSRRQIGRSLQETINGADHLLKKYDAGLTAASGQKKIMGLDTGIYNKDLYTFHQDTADAEEALDAFKNRIGTDTINTMRSMSAQGGAIGNITEREWPILQQNLDALNLRLGPDVLKANIKRIQDRLRATMNELEAAAAADGKSLDDMMNLEDAANGPDPGAEDGNSGNLDNGLDFELLPDGG